MDERIHEATDPHRMHSGTNLRVKLARDVFRVLGSLLVASVLLGFAVNTAVSEVEGWAKPLLENHRDAIVWGLACFGVAWAAVELSCRQRVLQAARQTAESEFVLLRECSLLTPMDLELGGGTRPHHPKYIPRQFQRYDLELAPVPPTYGESDLRTHLRNGGDVLLIGRPGEGKSRTLFEVLRGLGEFTVVRLRATAPSEAAIDLLRDRRIVLLVDNMNDLGSRSLSFFETHQRIRETARSVSVAAACRDGNELSAVRSAYNTELSRFYERIEWKLVLVPPTDCEKQDLASALRSEEIKPADYVTLGDICMVEGTRLMRARFDELSPDAQDVLRSMQLLRYWGLSVLERPLVESTFRGVFNRGANVGDVLGVLADQSFIAKPPGQNPVDPEDAYLRVAEDSVVRYSSGRTPEGDVKLLVETLERDQHGRALLEISVSQYYRGQHSETIESIEQALRTDLTPGLVAAALFNKGVALGQADDVQGAIDAYQLVVDRFGNDTEPAIREQVARALFNKGIALGQAGDVQGAINTYQLIFDRFGNDTDPAIREQVAKALVNKGVTLGQAGDVQGAINTYQLVVDRFGNDTDPAIREQVARALVNKGVALGQAGDVQGEIDTYQLVVDRFGNDTEPAIREQVAMALVNKGITLGQAGDVQSEIDSYLLVIDRFGNDTDPAIREQVAKALVNKGVTLGQGGDVQGEIDTCQLIFDRFGNDTDPAIREHVARALVNKGVTLGQADDVQGEIDTYQLIFDRFGNDTEPGIRERVARALVNKGVALGQAGDVQGAINTYQLIFDRFGNDTDPAIREQVAKALVNKGVTLGQAGDVQGEINTYQLIFDRFGNDTDPAIRERVARALVNKGVRLGQGGDVQRAIDTCQLVVDRFGNDTEPAIREQVARALVNKGVRLGQGGDVQRAIDTCQLVVDRFGNDTEPAIREQVAMALVNKGITLGQAGDVQSEIDSYLLVIDRFGDDTEPAIRSIFKSAEELLGTRHDPS